MIVSRLTTAAVIGALFSVSPPQIDSRFAIRETQRRFLHVNRRPEPGEPDRRTKGRTGARARVQARLAWNAGRR